MKSQVILLLALVETYETEFGINMARDRATILDRFKNQQNWFLEISLPLLDDALTSALSSGVLQPVQGYKLQRLSELPRFLNGLWKLVFATDGTLLTAPCPRAIRAIRQISRLFKKVFEVCADAKVDAAYQQFVETDFGLSAVKFDDIGTLREITQHLFGQTVGSVFNDDLQFKHGPGAVAERYDSVNRYSFDVVPDCLVDAVGMDTFKPFYRGETTDGSIPARVIAVPKTASKPRLISIEPSYNQFVQQGIHTVLKRELGKIRICGYLSQEPNKELARQGSIDGQLATIDLSEASDRVHNGLVKLMFGFNPSFTKLIDSCRSRQVIFPDGRTHSLNKFASMGSALTFPIETMVFTAIVVLSICQVESDYSAGFVRSLKRSRSIRVYGDDIIVPVKYATAVYRNLERYGLKVNSNKSFTKGHFRESCGGDYWRGHNVTPVYSRRRMPQTRRDVTEIVSLVSFRNQLWDRHCDSPIIEFLDRTIRKFLPDIPYGTSAKSGDLVLDSFEVTAERHSEHLQRPERKGYVVTSSRKVVKASDEATLFAAIAKIDGGLSEFPQNIGDLLIADDPHRLSHHTRPTSVYLKRRWVSAV